MSLIEGVGWSIAGDGIAQVGVEWCANDCRFGNPAAAGFFGGHPGDRPTARDVGAAGLFQAVFWEGAN